jgi:hypothetical protein
VSFLKVGKIGTLAYRFSRSRPSPTFTCSFYGDYLSDRAASGISLDVSGGLIGPYDTLLEGLKAKRDSFHCCLRRSGCYFLEEINREWMNELETPADVCLGAERSYHSFMMSFDCSYPLVLHLAFSLRRISLRAEELLNLFLVNDGAHTSCSWLRCFLQEEL